MISARTILEQLVAIPSVSNQTNRPLIEAILKILEPLGWHHRLFPYNDAAGIEKLNLIVSSQPPQQGSEDRTIEAELAIVCHTDTVPFNTASWPHATQLREQDGMLHGCGSCDVKGFLSCILAAVSELDVTRLRHRLCLVFTADEEIGCRGARFLVDQKALNARYAIIGEPTSLTAAHAGKGYCLASIHVKGSAAHSAYPDAGRSAIFAAARLLREIELISQELTQDRNDAFSPPWTTINVGEIHGGTAKNIVPADCSFLLEWRPNPGQPTDFVLNRLRSIIERLSSEQGPNKLEAEIEVLRLEQGFDTSPTSPVVRAVQSPSSAPAQTIAFGTEAPWLARMGAEAVVIGPGSMLTAHSPRECVPLAELEECVHLLRTAIHQLCN
jgi:acetylornithine deacetylase